MSNAFCFKVAGILALAAIWGCSAASDKATWTWKEDNGDKPGTALELFSKDGQVQGGKFYILNPNAPGDLSKGISYNLKEVVQNGKEIKFKVSIADKSTTNGIRELVFSLTLQKDLKGNVNITAVLQQEGGAKEEIELIPTRNDSEAKSSTPEKDK